MRIITAIKYKGAALEVVGSYAKNDEAAKAAVGFSKDHYLVQVHELGQPFKRRWNNEAATAPKPKASPKKTEAEETA